MTMRWNETLRMAVVGSLFSGAVILCAEPETRQTVILANSVDPDSIAVARYYAGQRGIPEGNIIALPMPEEETISWKSYIHDIHNPLLERFVDAGWVDGMKTRLRDREGRLRAVIADHRIAYLVLCRGVPLRIREDPERLPERLAMRAEFRTNRVAVDSVLSLMLVGGFPLHAFVRNPLYREENSNAWERTSVIRVARLDGPSPAAVRGLIDSALAGERDGLIGRAYVDMGGPHARGDTWLEETQRLLESAGFDTDTDRETSLFSATDRFDAPALYFGWHSGDIQGPFTTPGFRFPPGAIAMHIHSYSARTLRSGEAGWAGPLVEKGVALTVGNVFEPYLEMTHHPTLLLRALMDGRAAGDAAFYALPVLGWQSVFLGDPHYRPFSVSVDDQVRAWRENGDRRHQYAVIRKMNLLVLDGEKEAALALGRRALLCHPGLPLAYALARLLEEAGEGDEAVSLLGTAAGTREIQTDESMLAAAIVNYLRARGSASEADALLEAVAEIPDLPSAQRRFFLERAGAVDPENPDVNK